MKEIKWGIIGCGNVTETKSGPVFNMIKGSSLVAVMRRSADMARDYAQRHDVPAWYSNADDLIADPEINAVYIATPPSSHAEYAIKCLKAGKPVYVEKPMASCYSDCLRMNDVAEKTHVQLFTAYYRRTLPYFLKVKELVEKEAIGNILFVTIALYVSPRPEDYRKDNLPWRVIPAIAGGGYFYDLASHQLDLLDFLFGTVRVVTGKSYNLGGLYEAEDTVMARLEFPNKVIANGSWCFVVPENNQFDQIEIMGTKGSIKFSSFQFTPIILENQHGHSEYTPENPKNIQYYLIKSIVEELQGTGKSPSNGSNGASVNRVMEEIVDKK